MQQEDSRKSLRISLGGTGDRKQYMSGCKKFQKEKEEKKREIFMGGSHKTKKQGSR